ncbi:AAA family ATPase [Streptomyces zhihengii]|uniref:MoxR family ATPase n=1 Tax=Streptomyces zhihengii TaxID=1818004 RepID=A0ABS2V3P0_9ACTN|nr:MoxR family ATPase [Streptomyces zhihengii]MBM9624457.1 MoxR family ATPase [Streptomyces zhihengii]
MNSPQGSNEESALPGEDWWIYRGSRMPHDGIEDLPDTPAWRAFGTFDEDELLMPPADTPAVTDRRLGRTQQAEAFQADVKDIQLVNLALHLRRPLLITGKPGVGKSTLAYAVAHELGLGPVLRWSITSRSTLRDGLYVYDAIGRLHDAGLKSSKRPSRNLAIGKYLRLGPLGTALLPWRRPRVLLIDEIDKCDVDLPNDLLNVFEEGEYTIPELSRLGPGRRQVMTSDQDGKAIIKDGRVGCAQFPLVVLTSNGEREFPTAFLRRCVRLKVQPPDEKRLAAMVAAHLGGNIETESARTELIAEFLRRQREEGAVLANDQLLNALLMAERGLWRHDPGRKIIQDVLLRSLSDGHD